MYYVYIIKSLKIDWFYVGLTSNLKRRLSEHNRGKTHSTKAYYPFKLVYSKKFASRMSARDYEKFLKVRANKEKILRNLGIM